MTWLEESEAARWESYLGEHPRRRIDTHPKAEFVALRHTASEFRAAVFDSKSKRVVWRLDDAVYFRWNESGDRILVVRGVSVDDLRLEWRTWPARSMLASGGLKIPTGWVHNVALGHKHNVGTIAWIDQTEAGFEVFTYDGKVIRHATDRSYYCNETGVIGAQLFGPDDRYLVTVFLKRLWWGFVDWDVPSAGGTHQAGWIVVGDLESGNYRKKELWCNVPKGWMAEGYDDEYTATLEFESADHFTVAAATGHKQRLAVRDFF